MTPDTDPPTRAAAPPDGMTAEETVIREWVAGMTRESGAPLPPSQRRAEPLPRRRVLPVVVTLLGLLDEERGRRTASQRPTGADLAAMPEPEFAAFVAGEGIGTVTTAGLASSLQSPEPGAASVDAALIRALDACEPIMGEASYGTGRVVLAWEVPEYLMLRLRAAIRAEAVAPPAGVVADLTTAYMVGEQAGRDAAGEAVAPVGLPLALAMQNAGIGLLVAVDNAALQALVDSEDGAEVPDWQERLWDAADAARAVLTPIAAARRLTEDPDHAS